MNMDETIIVSSQTIIDKLWPWKDYKESLKHRKEDILIKELGRHLCIEEQLRLNNTEEQNDQFFEVHMVSDCNQLSRVGSARPSYSSTHYEASWTQASSPPKIQAWLAPLARLTVGRVELAS